MDQEENNISEEENETQEEKEERLLEEFRREMKRMNDEEDQMDELLDTNINTNFFQKNKELFEPDESDLDPAEIAEFTALKQEAEMNDNPSKLFEVGQRYEYGKGTHQSLGMASQYYNYASSLGSEEAKERLISLHAENSSSVPTIEEKPKEKSEETEAITNLKKLEFQEVRIPFQYKETNSPFCSIYSSKNASKSKKLVLVIPGSKETEIGNFSPKENGSLASISQKFIEKGYGVLLLNPNTNSIDGNPIPGSESASKHVAYVWENVVLKFSPISVYVLTYGFGSTAFLGFLRQNPLPVIKKVAACAFIESQHRLAGHAFFLSKYKNESLEFISNRCVNWKKNSKPLDSPLPGSEGCTCLSGGTMDTNEVLKVASPSILKYFDSKM